MSMKIATVIRAWKDEEYRQSLSDAERSLLPAHPAGLLELTDEELGHVAGGSRSNSNSGGGRRRRRRRGRRRSYSNT
jgi:mersacidin/lichenicidin family type 2 lantibiotic